MQNSTNQSSLTYGDVIKIYGTWEAYRKTPEGLLSSIKTCKDLIEEEKENLLEADRLYFLGEPLEDIQKMRKDAEKAIEFYMKKIESLVNQYKNTR